MWNESFFSAPQLKRDSLGGTIVRRFLGMICVMSVMSGCLDPATHIAFRATVPARAPVSCLTEAVRSVPRVQHYHSQPWQPDTTIDFEVEAPDSVYGSYLHGYARMEPDSIGTSVVTSVGWMGSSRPLNHERYAETQARTVFDSIASRCWHNVRLDARCTYNSARKIRACPSARGA